MRPAAPYRVQRIFLFEANDGLGRIWPTALGRIVLQELATQIPKIKGVKPHLKNKGLKLQRNSRRWHHSCYNAGVSHKQKTVGKTSGASGTGAKTASCIRLDDLMPRKTVTGGNRLLFGASSSSQKPNNQKPGQTS